jgi:hypothetical protein
MQDVQLPLHLPLQWNARCATSTCVANTRKREMCILVARLALGPHAKISFPCSLSPHLANFRPHALSHSAITLETTAPPLPPAILDLGSRACCRLIPSPGARHCLNPGLRVCHRRPLPQALGHCHAATVDLDSASLGARHRRWPWPRLPLSTLLPSSSTSLGIKL